MGSYFFGGTMNIALIAIVIAMFVVVNMVLSAAGS